MVSGNAIEITKLLLQGMMIEPRLKLLFLTSRKLDEELKKHGADRFNRNHRQEPITIYDRRLFLLAQKEEQLKRIKKATARFKEQDKETFDADIVSTKDGFTYFNEVEVKSSWKDEWLTILFSIPLILAFIPGMEDIVRNGFQQLEQMPEWYQYSLGVIVAASFGVRSATKFFGKK